MGFNLNGLGVMGGAAANSYMRTTKELADEAFAANQRERLIKEQKDQDEANSAMAQAMHDGDAQPAINAPQAVAAPEVISASGGSAPAVAPGSALASVQVAPAQSGMLQSERYGAAVPVLDKLAAGGNRAASKLRYEVDDRRMRAQQNEYADEERGRKRDASAAMADWNQRYKATVDKDTTEYASQFKKMDDLAPFLPAYNKSELMDPGQHAVIVGDKLIKIDAKGKREEIPFDTARMYAADALKKHDIATLNQELMGIASQFDPENAAKGALAQTLQRDKIEADSRSDRMKLDATREEGRANRENQVRTAGIYSGPQYAAQARQAAHDTELKKISAGLLEANNGVQQYTQLAGDTTKTPEQRRIYAETANHYKAQAVSLAQQSQIAAGQALDPTDYFRNGAGGGAGGKGGAPSAQDLKPLGNTGLVYDPASKRVFEQVPGEKGQPSRLREVSVDAPQGDITSRLDALKDTLVNGQGQPRSAVAQAANTEQAVYAAEQALQEARASKDGRAIRDAEANMAAAIRATGADPAQYFGTDVSTERLSPPANIRGTPAEIPWLRAQGVR